MIGAEGPVNYLILPVWEAGLNLFSQIACFQRSDTAVLYSENFTFFHAGVSEVPA